MKRLLFLILITPLISHAQNCISGTDPKSGKSFQVGTTFLAGADKGPGGALNFSKDGDKQSLQFAYNFNVKTSNYSTDKLLLLVKFVNGDVKKFTGNRDTRIYPSPMGISVNFVIDLTENDILYFKNNQTTNFKICYQGDESNGYDTEIDNKTAINIIKSLDCIVPVAGHIQNCISTNDPKTGKHMKSGVTMLKDTTDLGTVAFTRFDNDAILLIQRSFVMKQPLKESEYNTEKSLLQIKFANGDIKNFRLNWRSVMMPLPDGLMIVLSTDLTDIDLTYFKQNAIVLIKAYNKGNEDKGYNTIITADQAAEIMHSVSCIE